MATIKVPSRTKRTGDTWTPIAPEGYRKQRCGGGSCGSHGGTSGGGCGHKKTEGASAAAGDSCGDCHSCPVSAMTEGDREAVHRALMKAGYAGDRDHVPQLPDDWESDESDGSAVADVRDAQANEGERDDANGDAAAMSRDKMDTRTRMTTEDLEATGGPGTTRAVIAVRFPDSGKLYYYDPVDLDPQPGEWVVVETPRGKDAAKVFVGRSQVVMNRLGDELSPVIRLVRPDELTRMERLGDDAKEALVACAERIRAHNLPMKLVKAEYGFDASRLTFYFTSEGRVDFRTLVRELASQFRARIELRQVGARDEARLLGGVGRCGLTLCCATWLPDYPPTSIKQAKEQDLPLNPQKISGVCGRLLCCLSYEYDTYVSLRRNLPRIGQTFPTPEGDGRVIAVQVLKQSVRVALDAGGVTDVEIGDGTDRQWQGEAVTVELPPIDPPPIPDRFATGGANAPPSTRDPREDREPLFGGAGRGRGPGPRRDDASRGRDSGSGSGSRPPPPPLRRPGSPANPPPGAAAPPARVGESGTGFVPTGAEQPPRAEQPQPQPRQPSPEVLSGGDSGDGGDAARRRRRRGGGGRRPEGEQPAE